MALGSHLGPSGGLEARCLLCQGLLLTQDVMLNVCCFALVLHDVKGSEKWAQWVEKWVEKVAPPLLPHPCTTFTCPSFLSRHCRRMHWASELLPCFMSCVSCLSHCWDKIPEKINSKAEGDNLLMLTYLLRESLVKLESLVFQEKEVPR